MAKQWMDGVAYDLWIRRGIKNFVDCCNKNNTISAMFMFKEYRRTNVSIVLSNNFIINYKMHGIVTLRSRLTTSLFFQWYPFYLNTLFCKVRMSKIPTFTTPKLLVMVINKWLTAIKSALKAFLHCLNILCQDKLSWHI